MSAAAIDPAAHLSTEPLRILVVDDDEDARNAVACALLCLGHPCVLARDGLEAWEMFGLDGADIVISDWRMPRMTGIELCRRIRGNAVARGYTHFIFVTGNRDAMDATEGMRAGADDYLVKPIDIDQLETRLVVARRVLAFQRATRKSDSGPV